MRAFNPFYHSVGITWVSKTHPAELIDSAMGIQGGSGNLGVFLAFISAGYFAQTKTWKAPLILWSILVFILGSISFLLVAKTRTRSRLRVKYNLSSRLATLKTIHHFIPGFIFGGIGWVTTVYFAPPLLNHKFGFSMTYTGFYLAALIGTGIIVSFLFGLLSRVVGRRRITLVALFGSSFFSSAEQLVSK